MKNISSRKFFVPVLVFVFSLALALGVWIIVKDSINRELSLQFESETNEITSLIQDRMDLYTNVVYGAQGLFAASQSLQSNEWNAYVNTLDIPDNYSGISGMLYIERVSQSDRAKFPHTIYPQKTSGDYFPITYTTSVVSTSLGQATTTALGFDTSSDPVRWHAMEASEASGLPTASGVTFGVTNHIPLFNVYAPIYANGFSHTTRIEKSQNLVGFVAASFRITNLFTNLISNPIFDQKITIKVYDAVTPAQISQNTLLFDTASSTAISTTSARLSQMTTVLVAGRIWTLVFSALPEYQPQSVERFIPLIVILLGILFSFFLSWLIYTYTVSGEKAKELAIKIRKELQESEEKYQTIFESLQDVLYRTDRDGKITLVSPSIEKYTGVSANQMIGRNAIEFYPDTMERAKMLQELKEKGFVSDYPLTLYNKDKNLIQVSLNAHSLFDSDRQFIGVEGVLRDMTERQGAEDELKRLNALMVGRELKMTELKQEIKQLKEKK
jgi:PAS domain S-box-containing protein